MRTREQDVEPFVNLSELTEIELLIMRRMREFTIGEHRSLFHGSGFLSTEHGDAELEQTVRAFASVLPRLQAEGLT